MKKLTNRELAVAYFVVRGLKNKQIAEELNISVSTVKSMLEHIYEKTGYNNRIQVALMYYKLYGDNLPEAGMQ